MPTNACLDTCASLIYPDLNRGERVFSQVVRWWRRSPLHPTESPTIAQQFQAAPARDTTKMDAILRASMKFVEQHLEAPADTKTKEADDHEMIALSAEYLKQLTHAGDTQVAGNDIPPVESVFDLKSGARAKLLDRSGSHVIIEVDKNRSDWIEWSEVKARIAAK